MIYLLTGDDEISAKEFVQQVRKSFPENHIHYKEGIINSDEVKILTGSLPLFADNTLIILKPKNITTLNFDKDYLQDISDRKEITFIFYAIAQNLNSKVGKLLKELSTVRNFAVPKDYRFFNICDALFMENNANKALSLIKQSRNIEDDFYPLISLLQMSLRNYLSSIYQNKVWENTHPFMKRKIASYKINEEKAKALYRQLFEMDLASKTKKVDKMALLEEFVLYCG